MYKLSYCRILVVHSRWLFFFPSVQPPDQAEKKSGANLNSRSVKGFQSYRLRWVKWLTLENSEPASYEVKKLFITVGALKCVLKQLKRY